MKCKRHGLVMIEPPAVIEIDFKGNKKQISADEPWCRACKDEEEAALKLSHPPWYTDDQKSHP